MAATGPETSEDLEPWTRTRTSTSGWSEDTWWSVSRCNSELRAESPVCTSSIGSDRSSFEEIDIKALSQDNASNEVEVLDNMAIEGPELDILDNAAPEDPFILEDSWTLVDDNVLPMPAQPRALSISSTVESEWLPDDVSLVSSVAVSRNSSGASLPKKIQSANRVPRVVSWAHPWCQPDVPSGDSPCMYMSDMIPTPRALHRSVALLKALSYCEMQLIQLEKDVLKAKDSVLELEKGGACSKLCSDLVALAAEALECGFSRNVPGAMEIFEQTHAAVERYAGLLHRSDVPMLQDQDPLIRDVMQNSSPPAAPCRQFAGFGCGCFDWLKTFINDIIA